MSVKGKKVRYRLIVGLTEEEKKRLDLVVGEGRRRDNIVKTSIDLYHEVEGILKEDEEYELAIVKKGKVVKTLVFLFF